MIVNPRAKIKIETIVPVSRRKCALKLVKSHLPTTKPAFLKVMRKKQIFNRIKNKTLRIFLLVVNKTFHF